MNFSDRIQAEIKRGSIRNPDDEEIVMLESWFQYRDSAAWLEGYALSDTGHSRAGRIFFL